MARQTLALPALALAAVVAATTPVWPHARLKSASPPQDSTVKAGVAEIKLTFNEGIEPSLSVVELDDAAGQSVATSKGKAICEKKTCTLAVPPLNAGDYAVRYRVLSGDGHVVEGGYAFHVTD